MKRMLSAAFAMAVTVQLGAGAMAATTNFSDVDGYWAQPQIEALAKYDVMSGYPSGYFMPEETITRGEFAALLVKALKLSPSTMANYSDVPEYHWAANAISTVKANGYMIGHSDEIFAPNEPVDRLTVIKAIAKAYPKQATPQKVDAMLERFVDMAAIPTDAKTAVAETVEYEIFANNPTYGALLQPQRDATRGEVAALMSNLLSNMNYTMPETKVTDNYYVAKYADGNLRPYYLGEHVPTEEFVTIPETNFSATLAQPIDAYNTNVGDMITLTTDNAISSKSNILIAPQGSKFVGQVVDVIAPSALDSTPTIKVQFKELVTTTGKTLKVKGGTDSLTTLPTGEKRMVKLNDPIQLIVPVK